MDDFSGLEYDQESVCEEDVVSKTNNLLSQFNLPTQVTCASDITASLFVVLYESLFSDRLPGIVRQPVTREDEIHNCQMVVDVLSADVIKDNLSHIRGVDIVEGKVQSINNLLDIFTFLYEYVIKQIESDVPTDTEDDVRSLDRQDLAVESPDMLTPVIDTLDMDKGECRQNGAKNGTGSGSDCAVPQRVGSNGSLKGAATVAKGTNKVPVAAARSKTKAATVSTAMTAPSPIHPNASTSLLAHDPLDSTEELIQEGERLDRHFTERARAEAQAVWEETDKEGHPGQFDFIGVRPVPTTSAEPTSSAASVTEADAPRTTASYSAAAASVDAFLDSAHPVSSSGVSGRPPSTVTTAAVPSHLPTQHVSVDSFQNMSATAPLLYRNQRPGSSEKLRSTVGAVPYHSRQAPEKPYHHRETQVKGLSSSYEDLHHMVQHTAAMTRAALETSPMRRHQDRATLLDITDLSHERRQLPPSDALSLARELNLQSPDHMSADPYSVGDSREIHPACKGHRPPATFQDGAPSEKATAFAENLMSREDISTEPYRIPPNTEYRAPTTRAVIKPVSKQRLGRQDDAQLQSRYPLDSKPEPHKAVSRLQERYQEVVDDSLSTGSEVTDLAETRRRRLERKDRLSKSKLSSKLDEIGKTTLANAQRHLETEDKVSRRKQNFLKKLYEEEFEDVVDEVKNLVGKDRMLMKDMEEEYRKLLIMAAGTARKPKPSPKGKGYLLPTTRRSKSLRSQASSKTRQKKSGAEEVSPPRERPLTIGEDEELMPVLLEEFPHLHLSDHTWHELWRRGITQIENLTRAYEENKRRKSKAQVQLEEAARKHEVLAAIVKKQMEHNQRMHMLKDQKKQQIMANNRLHEKRSQAARARRYYNEFQVRSRAKMLKRRSKEEMVFKNLFKDGLAIQKDRIREVRRYAKEQREKQAKKRQDEIDSLENYYRDQFEMLVGKLVKDREDMVAREQAHQKLLEQMKRDLRRKMEKEIVDIQTEMFRDDDDTYFRQLEADRLRQELHLAKFQTRV